jgi:hypothetical protein
LNAMQIRQASLPLREWRAPVLAVRNFRFERHAQDLCFVADR